MSFNPLTTISAIVGTLLTAGALAWVTRRHLVVLVRRSFSYSHLGPNSLVELSVFNRGFGTEEDIEVTLNHTRKYAIIGSNSQDVTMQGNKLWISRIGSSDEVTVLLDVAGSAFKQDDIVQCLSRQTTGKIVSLLSEVSATGPQRIRAVAVVIALALSVYAGTYVMNHGLAKILGISQTPIEVHGWQVPGIYNDTGNELFESFTNGKLAIHLYPTSRKGDWVTVPVTISNSTDGVIDVSVDMTTAASAKRAQVSGLTTGIVTLTPGQSARRSLRVIIPENADSESDRTIFVSGMISDTVGTDTLSMRTEISVK